MAKIKNWLTKLFTKKAPGLGNEKPVKTGRNKKKLFYWLGGGVVFLVLVWFLAVSPLLAIKKEASQANQLVAEAQQAFSEKNLTVIKAKINQLDELLIATNQPLKRLAWLKIVPVARQYFFNIEHGLVATEKLLDAGQLAIEAISPYADIIGFQTDETASQEGEEKTQDRIEFMMETGPVLAENMGAISDDVNLAVEELNQINQKYLPDNFRGLAVKATYLSIKDSLDTGATFISGLQPFLADLPYFFGQDEPRTYLVLFQNDSELRPSGGFLTAYSILEVENGQFNPILSEDIYDLDDRFSQLLDAPRPIADYLTGVYYWNLRDMNLSPDFVESMDTFYSYYQQAANTYDVDCIMAVDTKFLASLLEITGPIGVSGYGEFSAEPDDRCDGCPQVVYQLESMITKPLGTLVSDRKAVLGPLMQSVILNVINSPANKMPSFFQAIITSIEQKNLLLYALEEGKQAEIEGLNMSGRIVDYQDGDYFHLNDANFGGAKSNLFIEQTVDQTYSVDGDGTITKEIKIKYSNPSPASDCNLESGGLCLNGLYRNWFRIYVPLGSQLIEMTGSEVEPLVYEELGKTVFEGFFGDTYPLYPNGGTSIVTLTYQLPFKYESGQDFDLLIQKQPGTKNNAYTICFEDDCQEFELNKDKELSW